MSTAQARFVWDDPFLLRQQLSEEERMRHHVLWQPLHDLVSGATYPSEA